MNSCLPTPGLYVRVCIRAQSYELGYDFVMPEHMYAPTSYIVKPYGTYGRNTSHTE